MNQLSDPEGASPTYLEWFAESSTLAGMAGWTLLFGYVGSMAMYAYAFGSYFTDIVHVEQVSGSRCVPSSRSPSSPSSSL